MPCLFVIFLCILYISCHTKPAVPGAFLENANSLPLESSASVYIIADVKEARSILDILLAGELKDKQARQMLDKTDFLAAALFPPENERRFQLAVRGNYPGNAGIAFNVSKDWEKKQSAAGQAYWHSGANGLSIALDSKQAFVTASVKNTPCDPITAAPGVDIPEGFVDFSRGHPFSCWLEDPSSFIYRMLNNAGVPVRFPVQKLFLTLSPAEDLYEASIRLQMENATQAKGFAALLNIAGAFVSDTSELMAASLFLANPAVQDGRNINIKTAPLSEAEVLRLFKF